MPSSPNCWHCGEALPAGVVIHARVAGATRPMCCQGCRAAAEWIEQLGLADYYALRTAPAQKPAADADPATHDSWQHADNARHVIRDLGDGLRESLLLVEGVRCTACVWLIERSLGAMPGVVSVQVNAVAQRARVIWRDSRSHACRNCCRRWRAPAITRCRSTRAASMTCGAANRATRSSGCWSRASAPCRP